MEYISRQRKLGLMVLLSGNLFLVLALFLGGPTKFKETKIMKKA
jgi:hypothetical protein